jgi:transcriptional regulator GlxA family with amidase domain
MSDQSKPLILLLAAPETSPSVLYGLYDVLYSVGAAYPDMTIGEPGPELLDVRIVAAEQEPFRCIGEISVEPHAAIDDFSNPDVVVVCDMYTPITVSPVGKYPREAAWLRKVHASGALICSVCTGSLVLAEAGLLDGRDTATHWAYRELFKRYYPKVQLRSEKMLCLTSATDGVVTAGGVTAWHDLAVYLIARCCGQRQAIETAKVFLISGHAEGQLPYAVMTRQRDSDDGVIDTCQSWIARNYNVSNPAEQMVTQSSLNPRTFSGGSGPQPGMRRSSMCRRFGWRRPSKCLRPKTSISTRLARPSATKTPHRSGACSSAWQGSPRRTTAENSRPSPG